VAALSQTLNGKQQGQGHPVRVHQNEQAQPPLFFQTSKLQNIIYISREGLNVDLGSLVTGKRLPYSPKTMTSNPEQPGSKLPGTAS